MKTKDMGWIVTQTKANKTWRRGRFEVTCVYHYASGFQPKWDAWGEDKGHWYIVKENRR